MIIETCKYVRCTSIHFLLIKINEKYFLRQGFRTDGRTKAPRYSTGLCPLQVGLKNVFIAIGQKVLYSSETNSRDMLSTLSGKNNTFWPSFNSFDRLQTLKNAEISLFYFFKGTLFQEKFLKNSKNCRKILPNR